MEGYKKGLWTEEEDKILMDYVKIHGKGHWNSISKRTGLNRCGKSCRLRWMNYLNPGIKRGHFSEEEQDLIIRLHRLLGNRWSLIAGRVPGRTDNQVKNYWNSHLSKKLNPTTTGPTNINIVVVGGDAPEANNKSGICKFDETSSAHSRQSLACSGSASDAAPMPLDTDARHHHPPPPAAAASQSQEGYPTNSCFWVSEFDGLMDLVTGSGTADSFHLDWDHL